MDNVVYTPIRGCMNLAATVNVLLYGRLAKSHYNAGDELIGQSRDNNNEASWHNREYFNVDSHDT